MHPLDFRILLCIARNAPTHGYAILQALEANPEVPDSPYPANFYRRIRDLRDQGWLVEVPPPAESPSDDRRRKFFVLTDLGREQMRQEGSRLEALLRDAGDLIRGEG